MDANTETFVGVYLKRVEPYDQALEAFLKSLDEHPGASLDNLPEHLRSACAPCRRFARRRARQPRCVGTHL